MDHSKKIIIFYASAGHGHEKAAQAVYEAYQKIYPHYDLRIVDVLTLALPFFGKWYKKSYLFQIQRTPWLWAFFYYMADIRIIYRLIKPLRRLVNAIAAKKLHDYLIHENPETVISAHFMSTEVTSYLKNSKKIKSALITIVTDYLPHWIWTAPRVDLYIGAIEETKEGLMRRGVPENRIKILGIPIEQKFLKKHSRAKLASQFEISATHFTVLLTSGGAGIDTIDEIVRGLLAISGSLQILVVCGTNKEMQANLSKIATSNPLLKVFGFVNNMDELMEVCDVVVGKGGGLTVSESLAKGKPLILFRSVPGQETRNAYCVMKYGAGFATNDSKGIITKLTELVQDTKKLDEMRIAVKRMAKPLAADQISEWVEHEYR